MIWDDDTYTNSPPVRDIWIRALPVLGDVRNGDYLTSDRLCRAFGLSPGQKFRDVLAAGERDGLLLIDRGSSPATYRATFILERLLRQMGGAWPD
ncbi:hypothetical protein J3D52_004574 [Achromobacter insolitus]|nr:hypothetical protein [Achromobacter insolitus]